MLNNYLVRQFRVIVVLAQEQHFTPPKLHFVNQWCIRVLADKLVEHGHGFVVAATNFVGTPQLVKDRVVAAILGIGFQQLLIKIDGVVVASVIDCVDILRELFSLGRIEFQIAKSAHRFGS